MSRPPVESSALGAACMATAMLLAAAIDVAVKALASDYSTAQIVLLRTGFAFPLVLAFCHYQGGLATIRTSRWGWQVYRGLLTTGTTFGFFFGLAYVPLVTAVLLAYISPVVIVLVSRLVLKEQVGVRRVAGCALGFAGVLFVLRPGNVEWHPAMLAILGSALCWALLSVSNRQLAGLETPAALTFHTLPMCGAVAGALSVDRWIQPQDVDWALFALAGLCSGTANFFVALAYRNARASTLAPLEYTNLIWAGSAAYVLWHELPSGSSVIGGIAILIGGFLAVRART